MTAHDKVSLLLANKAVLEEASPFFHRLHEFRLLLPDEQQTILITPRNLRSGIQQVLQTITKVRLVDQGTELGNPCDLNLVLSLDFLESAYPNLKSIIADVVIMPHNPKPRVEALLEELWPRLNHLELITRYWDSYSTDNYLQSIVPGFKWSCYKAAEQRAKI